MGIYTSNRAKLPHRPPGRQLRGGGEAGVGEGVGVKDVYGASGWACRGVRERVYVGEEGWGVVLWGVQGVEVFCLA